MKSMLRSSDSTSQRAVTVVTEELIRLLELEVKEFPGSNPGQVSM